jgi:hypothetical protein
MKRQQGGLGRGRAKIGGAATWMSTGVRFAGRQTPDRLKKSSFPCAGRVIFILLNACVPVMK